MKQIKVQSLRASRLTVVLSLVSLVLGVLIVLLVTYNISRPLRRLEKGDRDNRRGEVRLCRSQPGP